MSVPKRRKDSFFGMHFDFHASPDQENIGADLHPEVIARLLSEVKPDYVQCDTKGHTGGTSYPTRVGLPSRNMKGDLLRMWRDETARAGVALYAHHSGVWDANAIHHHPEYASVGADGVPNDRITSVFGPYGAEFLARQLIEMAVEYRLDGAWVDGDCWATVADYSEGARTAWAKEHAGEPPMPGEEGYPEYLAFCRRGFLAYAADYMNRVHAAAPDFQITSNWAFTAYIPEKPCIPLDYISGDYSHSNSVFTARMEPRYILNQGLPWDLMAWGFTSVPDAGYCSKELAPLCQEAAEVIALGGGFQIYNPQLVGTVNAALIPMWAELASFCRAREELCFRAKSVPQVAVIRSTADTYRRMDSLFAGSPIGDGNALLRLALENQYHVEVLLPHNVDDGMLARFPLALLGDVGTLEPELKAQILDYVRAGGKLLICGGEGIRQFADVLALNVSETKKGFPYVSVDNRLAPTHDGYVTTDAPESAVCAYLLAQNRPDCAQIPGVLRFALGRGEIRCLTFSVYDYANHPSAAMRDFVGRELRALFPNPRIRVDGTHLVDVTVMEKDGELRYNLINTAGDHANTQNRNFDEIPPLYHIPISIECAKPSATVRILPAGERIPCICKEGRAEFILPRLDIHSVLILEENED